MPFLQKPMIARRMSSHEFKAQQNGGNAIQSSITQQQFSRIHQGDGEEEAKFGQDL